MWFFFFKLKMSSCSKASTIATEKLSLNYNQIQLILSSSLYDYHQQDKHGWCWNGVKRGVEWWHWLKTWLQKKNHNNYNNNWSCWTHSTAQKSSCLCHLHFKSDREKLTASAGILRLWQDKHICKEQILVVTSVAKSQL